jgi:hypothetical protein
MLAMGWTLAAWVGAGLVACSASSTTGSVEGGAPETEAAADAGEDATLDSGGGGGSDDVVVNPEAQSFQTPDACFLLGATCLDDTMCCSALCLEGGCTLTPRQQ